jgi:hypothetical protein
MARLVANTRSSTAPLIKPSRSSAADGKDNDSAKFQAGVGGGSQASLPVERTENQSDDQKGSNKDQHGNNIYDTEQQLQSRARNVTPSASQAAERKIEQQTSRVDANDALENTSRSRSTKKTSEEQASDKSAAILQERTEEEAPTEASTQKKENIESPHDQRLSVLRKNRLDVDSSDTEKSGETTTGGVSTSEDVSSADKTDKADKADKKESFAAQLTGVNPSAWVGQIHDKLDVEAMMNSNHALRAGGREHCAIPY